MRLSRRKRLVIVTLHRVGPRSSMTADSLRTQLEFLARNYRVILPSQLFSVTAGNRGLAMVTVDDCHRDIYEHLFPIAASLKIPFGICVPTDFFFRDRWLWFDQLYWTLKQAAASARVDVRGHSVTVGDKRSVEGLKLFLKATQPVERDAILSELAHKLGAVVPAHPTDDYRPVAAGEMREMLASGLVDVISHTVTHTIATVLPPGEFERELHESKRDLETFCGRKVLDFCYPNGHDGDFNDVTTKLVRAAGYRTAFTSVEGVNRLARMDRFLLKRIHAHRDQSVFERRASGLEDIRPRFGPSLSVV
jgi:peptidoglycan/xylan/chitin deacetylase (PgdA/CDA1 family)